MLRGNRQPFHDGARALLERGITGPFEIWDAERPYLRMAGDVETAAGLTVEEADAGGIRVRRRKPHLRRDGRPQNAVQAPAATTTGDTERALTARRRARR